MELKKQDQLEMNGENVDSTQGDEQKELEIESQEQLENELDIQNGPDLLADRDSFHDEDYDPELEEDPEKITCGNCDGHGEDKTGICESCSGMGYILRNDVLLQLKEDVEINQELLVSIISILHPLAKAFHEGSINKNDLARKSFMNAAGIANDVFSRINYPKESDKP